jgi:hypothetical protein
MKKMVAYILFIVFLAGTTAQWFKIYLQSNFAVENIMDSDKDEKKESDDFSKDKITHCYHFSITTPTILQQFYIIPIPLYVNPFGKVDVIPPEIISIS